jgi:hypothetical protein
MAFLTDTSGPKVRETITRDYSGSGVTETTWVIVTRVEEYACDDGNSDGESIAVTKTSTVKEIGTDLYLQSIDAPVGHGGVNGICRVIYEGRTAAVLLSSL